MIRARTVAVALTAAAIVTAAASPALAAANGRILKVERDGQNISILFTAQGIAESDSIDPASVGVTFNDAPLTITSAKPAAESATVSRAAMLVIDTSGSMAGDGIAGAKSAASAFIAAVPDDVEVGLVTFSDRPQLVSRPTADHAAIESAVRGLKVKGETALYDAAVLASEQLSSYSAKTIVLLTDGNDTTSRASLASASQTLKKSESVVDAIGFRTTDAQGGPLRTLAGETGGRVISAGAADALAQAFRQAAQDIAEQVVIAAEIPSGLAGQGGTLEVTASAAGATLTDSAFVTLPALEPGVAASQAAPKPVDVDTGGLKSSTGLAIALVLVFLALGIIAFFAVGSLRRGDGKTRIGRRLSIYTLTGRVAEKERETTAFGESNVARSAVDLAGRAIAKRDFESALARQLEASAVPLRPAEWLLIQTGVMVAVALLMFLLTGGKLVGTLMGLVLGIALPLGFLKVKESRRQTAFLAALPDTLQLIAGSLSAGYSLPQAVDTVVAEGTEPIAGEFKRALIETRLGVAIEDALEGIAGRIRSKDFGWVVMAIRIQRDVGGNLAEVLVTTAATLRERERIRRQVQVLSAEGRLSAWILGGLPILFALYLILVRPSYVKVLVTDSIGVIMLVSAVVLMTVGTFWLRKVVKVDV
jgi:tight adherence protein B